MVGLYHFTYGLSDPNKEADFFVDQVKKLGYLNKAVLVVDYEADALSMGRNWVKQLCDRIKAKAGYAPILYCSSSFIAQQNLGSLGYLIWNANYFKGYQKIYGYNTSGCVNGYPKAKIWQFTSTCILSGYAGNLDANVFYGTKNEWKKLAGMKIEGSTDATQPSTPSKPATEQPKDTKLDVDGTWGQLTTKELQKKLKVTQDGIISNQRSQYKKYHLNCSSASWKYAKSGSSSTIKALQKKLKVDQDGIAGPATIKALQKRLKVEQDGYCGPNTVKALQKKLNSGTL